MKVRLLSERTSGVPPVIFQSVLLLQKQAHKPQSYDSLKLQPTHPPTEATGTAKKASGKLFESDLRVESCNAEM